jgi:hypothetical protein
MIIEVGGGTVLILLCLLPSCEYCRFLSYVSGRFWKTLHVDEESRAQFSLHPRICWREKSWRIIKLEYRNPSQDKPTVIHIHGTFVLGFTTFPFYIAGNGGIQPCSDQATCSKWGVSVRCETLRYVCDLMLLFTSLTWFFGSIEHWWNPSI